MVSRKLVSAADLASVLQLCSGFCVLFQVFCLLMKQEKASMEALTSHEGEERKKECIYGAVKARQQRQKNSL